MSDDFEFVRELLGSCRRKERKYKTFIMKDSSTKLFRIAKAEDIEKRFKVLYASNPNLTIAIVINDNVKSNILKDFESKATGQDWLSLNDEDIQAITNKYNVEL